MGSFLSTFKKKESRILMLGLDNAGKTTMLYKLKLGEDKLSMPTIGFNVETLENSKINLIVWDLGGQDKIRRLWKHYYSSTKGIIYVIDSSDKERLDEAIEELKNVVNAHELKNIPVLIYANKQDIENALTDTEIIYKLTDIISNEWYVQSCSTKSGEGLLEGINWLINKLKKNK